MGRGRGEVPPFASELPSESCVCGSEHVVVGLVPSRELLNVNFWNALKLGDCEVRVIGTQVGHDSGFD